MRPNTVIDYEISKGRSKFDVVRRLYVTESPYSLKDRQEVYFDICDTISKFFSVPIYMVQAAGSAQTGASFHNNREFRPKESDFDVAVISSDVYEKYLRAVQRVALPNADTLAKANRSIFPTNKGESYYNDFMHNVTFYGVIMPFQMPTCPEKGELNRMLARLSEKYAEMFSNINVAIYISNNFFERKQCPNIAFYNEYVRR